MGFKGKRRSNVFGSEEGYDLFAGNYDESLAYLDSFESDILLKELRRFEGKKVLDIGCGTGRVCGYLKSYGAKVTGTDISEKMLMEARKKHRDIEFVRADANNLPFKDNTFDAVTAMFLIVHMKDPLLFFREAYRVLKEGGVFIFSNINQKKAPKLKTAEKEEIVIKSYYHLPKHIINMLEDELFQIEKEEFFYEGKIWVNQIIKAKK